MQIVVASRKQFYDVVTFESSPPIDVSGMPMVTVDITVHSISGSGAQLDCQLQTSDDLETWADVGTAASKTTTGFGSSAVVASSTPYARYVRVQYQVTGTTPLINATVAVNTYQSS